MDDSSAVPPLLGSHIGKQAVELGRAWPTFVQGAVLNTAKNDLETFQQ